MRDSYEMAMPYTLTINGQEVDGKVRFILHPSERGDRYYPGAPAYAEVLDFLDDSGRVIELSDSEAKDLEGECQRWGAEEMEAGYWAMVDAKIDERRDGGR